MKIILNRTSLVLVAVAFGSLPLKAANVVWAGASGDYLTGSNWVGGVVPDTAGNDTAIINTSDVAYNPGGDYTIGPNGGLTINGGSWSQPAANNFINLNGSLTITGGVFNQGLSGHILRAPTTSITVSGGLANFTGDLAYDPLNSGSINFTGGTINIATEFKPIQDFTVSAGALNANLISFSDGPGSLIFSGGTITVDGSGPNSGFYGGGTKGLNFTAGGTGSLFIANYSLADLSVDGFLTNGTIQYNGAINAAQFTAVESAGGVVITAVPEPAGVSLTAVAVAVAGMAFARRRARRA